MSSPQNELFPLETAQHLEYKLLTGHNRTNGSFKSTEELHREYINLTDDLIRQMTEGVAVYNTETQTTELKKPDYVVWLDKSARPVSWLTKELWPLLATDEDGQASHMPQFRYVNIDREQWINKVDPNGSGFMDITRIDQSVVRSLRSIFLPPEVKKEGLTSAIDAAESELDNKTVLIVDEVRASGRTLDIATKFFKRAFPNTAIATTHWMRGITQIESAQGNADLPVWYREQVELGRGVGNRDERKSQQSQSLTQRLGCSFLSTALREQDTDSMELRREFRGLARKAMEHQVLILPSTERTDYIDRAERLNDKTFEEFKSAKQQIEQ